MLLAVGEAMLAGEGGTITVSLGLLGAVFAFIMAAGVVGGAFLRYERRITIAEASASATAITNAAQAIEIGRVRQELAEFREKAAAKFVHDHELDQVEK